MVRQNIIRRLLYLRNWEFVNIFFLPLCLYSSLTSLKTKNWQPYASAMLIICIILAQGVLYWHLKLQTIRKNETGLPLYFSKLFSFFQWADIVLLSIYLFLAVCNQITALIDFRTTIWSDAIFLFAILEYVNYFYYQLSHDNMNDIRFLIRHKKIRRSPLYVDLHKNQGQFQELEQATNVGNIGDG